MLKEGSSDFCLGKTAKAAHGRGELLNKAHSRSNSGCSPSFVPILRASSDLGLPPDHGEKQLLRMLFGSQ